MTIAVLCAQKCDDPLRGVFSGVCCNPLPPPTTAAPATTRPTPQPVVVEPVRPSFIQCSVGQECVSPWACASASQQNTFAVFLHEKRNSTLSYISIITNITSNSRLASAKCSRASKQAFAVNYSRPLITCRRFPCNHPCDHPYSRPYSRPYNHPYRGPNPSSLSL